MSELCCVVDSHNSIQSVNGAHFPVIYSIRLLFTFSYLVQRLIESGMKELEERGMLVYGKELLKLDANIKDCKVS
jgi:hypothetical protein